MLINETEKLRKQFLVQGTTSTLDLMRVKTGESPMGRNNRFPRLCFRSGVLRMCRSLAALMFMRAAAQALVAGP
jgi:hypothetical protein